MANHTPSLKLKIFFIIFALILPITLITPILIWKNTPKESNDQTLIAIQKQRLTPVGKLSLAGESETQSTTAAPAFHPENTYKQVCALCHDTGLSGAVLFGDHSAWQAKINERGGTEALAQQGIQGINAMPPKGGALISDDEFKQVVAYILENADIDPSPLPTHQE